MDEQLNLVRLVSDSFDKAKNGDALNVYAEIAAYHDNGTLPSKSHYPFGWIIYYALHASASNDIERRKRMLARYMRLTVEKPHKLHSMILTEAIRLYKDARDAAFTRRPGEKTAEFSIVRFTALWDLANLRPGDWRRKDFNDKTLGSTAEKLITLCVNELEETGTLPSPEFTATVDRAVAEYPDSFNLLSQRAALHILAGERKEAASLLRRAILAAPGKFYLWSRMASLVGIGENIHLRVALLYKALQAPGPDRFKGRIRLSLAEAWLSRNAYGCALWELNHVRKTYEANGWHLPVAYTAAAGKIPADVTAVDPISLYRRVEHLADEEIYSELPAVTAVKTYHKTPKPEDTARSGFGKPVVAWRVTDNEGNSYWMHPHRFRISPDMPMGTRVAIRLHNGKVVAAKTV